MPVGAKQQTLGTGPVISSNGTNTVLPNGTCTAISSCRYWQLQQRDPHLLPGVSRS
jgi:hypothetical protein